MGYLNTPNDMEKEAFMKLMGSAVRKLPAAMRLGSRGLNNLANKVPSVLRAGANGLTTMSRRLPRAANAAMSELKMTKSLLPGAMNHAKRVANRAMLGVKTLGGDSLDAMRQGLGSAYRSLTKGEGLAAAGQHLKTGLRQVADNARNAYNTVLHHANDPRLLNSMDNIAYHAGNAVRRPMGILRHNNLY
jgi:hypothetical protein